MLLENKLAQIVQINFFKARMAQNILIQLGVFISRNFLKGTYLTQVSDTGSPEPLVLLFTKLLMVHKSLYRS